MKKLLNYSRIFGSVLIYSVMLFLSCAQEDLTEKNYDEIKNPDNVILSFEYNDNGNTEYNSIVVIGLWMFRGNHIADWANVLNKSFDIYPFNLYEPINALWIDYSAKTESEAIENIEDFLDKSAYLQRSGSSSGYYGIINDSIVGQYPEGVTWSDKIKSSEENNHGRVFTALKIENNSKTVFYSMGAFSRETGTWHNFLSFNTARDQLIVSGNWIEKENKLSENIYNTCSSVSECKKLKYPYSTLDHDGMRIFVLYPK